MRPFHAIIALCLLALLSGNVFAADRPNFVIMIADDVSSDDLALFGGKAIRTPNIDALRQRGIWFSSAFLTCSSCSPSRCSILTGRYPHATGAAELHQPLPNDQVTFVELLRAAGYYTAMAGKTHVGKPTEAKFDKVTPGGGESGCEKWVATLRDRPRDKPFFLWLAAFDAHRDYKPGAIALPHAPQDVKVPPYLPDVAETRKDLAMYYDEIARFDEHVGRVVAELKAQGVLDTTMIIVMADNGRAFPRCKTTLYDSGVQTPFIVHWPGRVKAQVKAQVEPGVTAGVDCSKLISSIDIAPTLLDLAGAKVGPTFQGRSFVKLLDDPTGVANIRDHVFAEHNWHDYQAHKRSVRTNKYLYIWNAVPRLTLSPPADAVRSPTFQVMRRLRDEGMLTVDQMQCFVSPRPAEELYDVQNDPHQLRNLADDPAHGEALKAMRAALEQWKKETQDQVPEKLREDKYDRETGKTAGAK